MTRTRTAAVTLAALLALSLAACSSDGGPEEVPTADEETTGTPDETEPEPTPIEEDEGDVLTLGETYTWDADGITGAITSVEEFTDIGEYDTEVPDGSVALRVHITLTNSGDQAVEVGDFDVSVEGATVGGEGMIADFEADARPFGGQVAPGAEAEFTADRTLDETYGTNLIVTLDRWDDPTLPRPQWAATIE